MLIRSYLVDNKNKLRRDGEIQVDLLTPSSIYSTLPSTRPPYNPHKYVKALSQKELTPRIYTVQSGIGCQRGGI